jgi:hypothetical protein
VSNDFIEVGSSAEQKPRWWRVLSVSGRALGLGFECPKCHYGFNHDAPKEIRHCGTVETAPFFTANLPVKQIGGGCTLPRNILPIGW